VIAINQIDCFDDDIDIVDKATLKIWLQKKAEGDKKTINW
jgi:hypothetical protein